MIISFEGQVALVTGAGAGMGLATAKAFAESGAAVVLAARTESAVLAAAEEINHNGGRALGIACDVSDERQVEAMFDRTIKEFGRLDAAFNNAGIQHPKKDTAEVSLEEWRQMIDINLTGVWLCMKYELRQMKKQGCGAIVNCSSLAGIVGSAGRAAYSATKHGLIGLTMSVAIEYGDQGVRVNTVCPGTIMTPMVERMVATNDLALDQAAAAQPIPRVGTVDEIANAVLWLCSSASSYVTGESISVDGGHTIV